MIVQPDVQRLADAEQSLSVVDILPAGGRISRGMIMRNDYDRRIDQKSMPHDMPELDFNAGRSASVDALVKQAVGLLVQKKNAQLL